jgi:hypothetical protein
MAHGQLSFLSVQISPALFLFAEFVVAKAKHLHLRLMQSELAPQEAAKTRLTVLGRLDFLCCFSFGSLLFRDLAVVQFRGKNNILLCIFTSPRKLVLRKDLNMQNKDITLVPFRCGTVQQ